MDGLGDVLLVPGIGAGIALVSANAGGPEKRLRAIAKIAVTDAQVRRFDALIWEPPFLLTFQLWREQNVRETEYGRFCDFGGLALHYVMG